MTKRKVKSESLADRVARGEKISHAEWAERIRQAEEKTRQERSVNIEDAFHYEQHADEAGQKLEQEKALRAVAYLLDFCSDFGSEELNGSLVLGIAQVLYCCAANLQLERRFILRNEKDAAKE